MHFELSEKTKDLQQRLTAFMEEHIYPNEQRFNDEIQRERWSPTRIIEELKPKARAAGLWNLLLPHDDHGAGLSNLEYAPLCEIMGRSVMAPEVFNCSAPDTGNMEVLARYGTPEQQERWLKPLLAAEIRSCFAMTEPAVASSDATNIESSIVRAGDELWLRLHFGMTGWLQYLKRDEETPKTARILFSFANNRRLAFDDQRKFGEVELIKDMDEFLQRRGIGPDALDVGLSEFKTIFRMHRGAVKAILLNQKLIAGIGNLYADEILFRACMHPATAAARLSDKDLSRLFRATHHVLEKAIALKTDFNRLPKSWLLTHRGKRGRCPRCGRALKSATIGGRTSWFCGYCQKRAHCKVTSAT